MGGKVEELGPRVLGVDDGVGREAYIYYIHLFSVFFISFQILL